MISICYNDLTLEWQLTLRLFSIDAIFEGQPFQTDPHLTLTLASQ